MRVGYGMGCCEDHRRPREGPSANIHRVSHQAGRYCTRPADKSSANRRYSSANHDDRGEPERKAWNHGKQSVTMMTHARNKGRDERMSARAAALVARASAQGIRFAAPAASAAVQAIRPWLQPPTGWYHTQPAPVLDASAHSQTRKGRLRVMRTHGSVLTRCTKEDHARRAPSSSVTGDPESSARACGRNLRHTGTSTARGTSRTLHAQTAEPIALRHHPQVDTVESAGAAIAANRSAHPGFRCHLRGRRAYRTPPWVTALTDGSPSRVTTAEESAQASRKARNRLSIIRLDSPATSTLSIITMAGWTAKSDATARGVAPARAHMRECAMRGDCVCPITKTAMSLGDGPMR